MRSYKLEDIPFGTRAIFDSNILVYWIMDHPRFADTCEMAVQNVEDRKIQGVIPAVVLNELLHRLMIAEAVELGLVSSPQDAVTRIKKKPEIISRLSIAWEVYTELKNIPFEMPDDAKDHTDLTYNFSKDLNLMAKDAAITAFAQSRNIEHIITNDRDFERVPFLTCWKP